jgi:hypothetical protein
VYLDAIKHMWFSNTAGNLSSSYVVGLLHVLFNAVLLTVPIKFQCVSEKLCVPCHIQPTL